MKSKKINPTLTVTIPMYNSGMYIKETISSILDERDIDLEVVVVNDGSTDNSEEQVTSICDDRVKIINTPNRGFISAANTAILHARGEIIMRCDADDLFPPGKISQQVKWLKSNPEFGAVCGNFASIDAHGRFISDFKCGNIAEEITSELQNGVVRNHFCTFAIQAHIIRKSKGGRIGLNGASDIDLQLRIGELCRVWYLPEISYLYRIHETSLTHTQHTVEREFYDELVIKLQKQRRAEGIDDLDRGLPLSKPPQINDRSIHKATEHISDLLLGSAWREHRAGNKLASLVLGIRSLFNSPGNLKKWYSLLALLIKPSRKTYN